MKGELRKKKIKIIFLFITESYPSTNTPNGLDPFVP